MGTEATSVVHPPPVPTGDARRRLLAQITAAATVYERDVYPGYELMQRMERVLAGGTINREPIDASYRKFEGNHSWWIISVQGDVTEIVGEEPPVDVMQEMWRLRTEEGALVMTMWPGVIGRPANVNDADLKWVWNAAVEPRYLRVEEGAFAGAVVGPLHGDDETDAYTSALARARAITPRHWENVYDSFTVLPADDLRTSAAVAPWQLLLDTA